MQHCLSDHPVPKCNPFVVLHVGGQTLAAIRDGSQTRWALVQGGLFCVTNFCFLFSLERTAAAMEVRACLPRLGLDDTTVLVDGKPTAGRRDGDFVCVAVPRERGAAAAGGARVVLWRGRVK